MTKVKRKKSLVGWIGANWEKEWNRVLYFFQEQEEELRLVNRPLIKKDTKDDKKDIKVRITIEEI